MSFFDMFSRKDEDYEDYDDGYDYDDYEEEKTSFFSRLKRKKDDYYEEEYEEQERPSQRYSSSKYSDRSDYKTQTKSNSYRYDNTAAAAPALMEIYALTADGFDGSANIVRDVKKGKTVIFDVSQITSNNDARRVVDYISGAAEGMGCTFSRLYPAIFCIAPKSVNITVKNQSRYRYGSDE